jgi:hypothetical protein
MMTTRPFMIITAESVYCEPEFESIQASDWDCGNWIFRTGCCGKMVSQMNDSESADKALRLPQRTCELGDGVLLPQTTADLCKQAGDIPETDLPALIAQLSPDPEAADAYSVTC